MTSARIADYVVSEDAVRYKLLLTKNVKKGSPAVFEDEKKLDFLTFACPRDYEAGETTWCKIVINHRERLVLCHEDLLPMEQQGTSRDFEVTFWDAAKQNDVAKFYRDVDHTWWEFHCRRDYARFETTSTANKLMYPSVHQSHPKKLLVVPCSDPARSRKPLPIKQSASEEKAILRKQLNLSLETSKITNSRKALSTKQSVSEEKAILSKKLDEVISSRKALSTTLFDLKEKANLRKQLDVSYETSNWTHSRKQLPTNYSEDGDSKHLLKQTQLLSTRSNETTNHVQKRLYFDRYAPRDKENNHKVPIRQKVSKESVAPTSFGLITTSNHVRIKEPPKQEPTRKVRRRVHFDRYEPKSKENKHGISIHQTAKEPTVDSNSLGLKAASIFRNSKPPPKYACVNRDVGLTEISTKFRSDIDVGGTNCHGCGPTYVYGDGEGGRCSGICGQFYCWDCKPDKLWLGIGSEDRYCSLDCTKHNEPTYRRYKKLQSVYGQWDSDVCEDILEDLSSIAEFDDMDGY